MPQLDLDTLVPCDGGGAELTTACVCDTTVLSDDCSGAAEERRGDGDGDDPYAPAHSLRLRIGEDIDWSDVVAAVAVLERDDSTKGAGANPKCAARRSVAAAAARGSVVTPAPVASRAMTVVIGGLPAGREHGRRRSPRRRLSGGRASKVFATGWRSPGRQRFPASVACARSRRESAAAAAGGGRGWLWPTPCPAAGTAGGGRAGAKPTSHGGATALCCWALAADVASGHQIDRWSRFGLCLSRRGSSVPLLRCLALLSQASQFLPVQASRIGFPASAR
ncbi:unnamed protein product [Urochloa humidicola]